MSKQGNNTVLDTEWGDWVGSEGVALMRIPLDGDPVTDPPKRKDGSSWPLAISWGGNHIFSDCYESLVDEVVNPKGPGEGDRMLAMMLHAAFLKAQANGGTLADNRPELSEGQIRILSSDVPVGVWDAGVPLVVSLIDYDPYTDVPFIESVAVGQTPPYMNVVVLEPVGAEEYVKSLSAAGVLTLFSVSD